MIKSIKKLEPESLDSDNLTQLVNNSNKEIKNIKNTNKKIAKKIAKLLLKKN